MREEAVGEGKKEIERERANRACKDNRQTIDYTFSECEGGGGSKKLSGLTDRCKN